MKNFLKNTSGNVAVTVALLGIPLTLSAGAAVDYSQYARKQSSLQNVVDSAALAVALDLQTSNQAQVEAKVNAFLKANLTSEQYSEVQGFVVTIPPSKEKVTVAVEGEHPTTLMRIAGINSLNYTPESVVNAPTGNAEVMLVLDSTGSMALDGKMDALKVSASKFVEDVLKSNLTSERVKVGITPFARYVNVGLDNRDADWMNVPDDYTETKTIETRDVISSSGCSETTYTDNEGIQQTGTTCTNYEYGPTYEKEITNQYKWYGCAGSRNYPRNLTDTDFSFKVPGLLNAGCPNRITQLTTDEAVLKSEINSLSPSGSTYIPAGLTWGFRAVSSGDPFDDGISYADASTQNVQKVIVLMSDGENQSSINPSSKAWHNGNDQAQANNYTKEVCDNIKAEGIQVFTIGFGNSIPQATLNVLKDCSTDGTNYYNATDGAALTEAFSSITSKLAALYLSK